MEAIRVILVDDHQILREGIEYMLKDEPSLQLVGQATNGQELIQLLPHTPVDVVLMDLHMPEMDGFETAQYMKANFPAVRILVLSMMNSEKLAARLLDEGVLGYVLKTIGREELVYAIRKVASGQVYIGTDITMRLFKKASPKAFRMEIEPGELSVDLSKREVEVLELISEGYSNHEIAEKLCVSKRTIDSHRQNLIEKTRTKNTASLIRYAIGKGIIS
ncbi:MAG: response regulator transcription factor [Ferruginibacter sp.]|nr:response regulator transcription factor [Cytophagales bacterium]